MKTSTHGPTSTAFLQRGMGIMSAWFCLILLLLAYPAQAAPGDLDTTLNANIVGNEVDVTAVQPDGKIIIAGHFSSVLGEARNNIARLNADGTLDTGFNPNTNGQVFSVAVQADGKILLGGAFTTLRPNGATAATTRNHIARVNADGTLDTGFNPNADEIVFSLTVQTDGKILLGGGFHAIGQQSRYFFARVNTDGTLDTDFTANTTGSVFSVALQEDGKILLAGFFSTVGVTSRKHIARLNTDGTLDMGFNPDVAYGVYCVAVQAGGKILLGGPFDSVDGAARNYIARLNADGTLDSAFDPNADDNIYSVAAQADGKILIGGRFTTVSGNARNRIARLNANGTLDTGFTPNVSGGVVLSVALQANGGILLGGMFTTVGGQPQKYFARLLNDPATQTLGVVDATHVLWMRGGSAPAVTQTTFELSTNGGSSYTPLGGTAARVGSTANWQLTGLSLPASGQIRARGRTAGGYYSGSSGLVEQVQVFAFLPEFAFAPVGYTVTEGGTATLTINRSGSTIGAVSVTVATSSLSAAPSALATVSKDYTAKTQVLTFANGESSKTFDVQTLSESPLLVEANETFLVTLSAPTGGAVLGSAATARVTIIDPSSLTADATAPAITLTTPALNALVGVNTGGSTNLIGTATDAKGVEKVEFKVLTAGGTPTALTLATLGTPGGTSTTFTAPITPVTGLNTVEVKVTDYKGNTKSLTRIFKVTRPLQVILAGAGTVTTGYAGTSFREVGKPLNITATPGKDQVFDGWLVSNTAGTGITPLMQEMPKLTFTFSEGLALTAKFIPNPFTTALVGTFNGLALPDGSTTPGVANVGLINLLLGTKGSFTGSLKIDGTSLSTPGFFDNTGVARFGSTRATSLILKRTGKPDLEIALQLDMSGVSGHITGSVTQKLLGVVQAVSNVVADRAHYSTASKVSAALAGTTTKPYTLVFPSKSQTPALGLNTYPQGDGYATMTVNVNGTVSLTGKLADHTPITASAPLSKNNQWPIFAQLYATKGSFAGLATLADADEVTEDVSATDLQWFRPDQNVQWYNNGWPAGITVDLFGARYVVPPALPATSVFPGLSSNSPNAILSFTDGLLADSISQDITISTANLIASTSPTLVITKASGLISGTFTHTDLTKPGYQGVIVQKGVNKGGHGYFMSRATPLNFLGESGRVQVLAK